MLRIRTSFQGLILGGCLIVVLCTLVFVSIFLGRSLRGHLVAEIRDSLLDKLAITQEILPKNWDATQAPLKEADALADELGAKLGMRVTLIAADGLVLGDSVVAAQDLPSLKNHAGRPEVIQALHAGAGWSLRRSSTLGVDLLYAAQRMGTQNDPVAFLRGALPLSEVEEAIARVNRLILWASVLGVLLSVAMAFFVARRLSRPLKDLTQTALKISSGDLFPRLSRYAAHEIRELGEAFNKMADHLQKEISEVTRGRDRLEAILGAMVEGVMVTDHEGRIRVANRALQEFIGGGEPLEGKELSEIIRNAALLDGVRSVLGGKPHTSLEMHTLEKQPRIFEVQVVGLVSDPAPTAGDGAGAVAVFHDMTERKRLEEVRRDFVANVSHELRTPIAAIKGSVETLLDGAMNHAAHSRYFLDMIQRHVSRLQGLVEDLLVLARLESDESARDRVEIPVAELTDGALGTVTELAASRGVEINRELPREPLVVYGNRRELEQALVNLLDNAIKYTDKGGKVILAVAQPTEEEIHFNVIDTGIGIPEEHRARIFERFYRVDKARSRALGGTGLGLAIVKHAVQRHGGRVEVESTPGEGSTFRLVLSGKRAGPASPPFS